MAAKMDSTTSVPQQQLSTFPIIILPHMTQALPSGDPSHYFHWALNHFRDKSLTLGTQLANNSTEELLFIGSTHLIIILLGTWFVLTLWQEGLVLIYALF